MKAEDRIYVPPKRGRLPRRYELEAQWSNRKKAIVLIGCAFAGLCLYGTAWYLVTR